MFDKPWHTFLQEIETAKADLDFRKNEEYFFRGHTQTTHTLLPGILRNLNNGFSEKALWENESDMFYEFRARAKEVHNGNLCDWDVLFYMQHHLVKTRLLDWTESFGVALYFALLNYDETKSTPCIWLLNPYKLNHLYREIRDLYAPENLDQYDNEEEEWLSYADYLLYENPKDVLWWDKPIAIYPIRRVDRLTTQGGYFTIHGTDTRPIEKMIPASKKVWKKIQVPKAAIKSALLFLEYSGINHFTMFPDLDGLAKFLNSKYF